MFLDRSHFEMSRTRELPAKHGLLVDCSGIDNRVRIIYGTGDLNWS